MGKPEDIPQDVWDVADAAFDLMLCNCIEASGTSEQLRIDSTEPIARAILAERDQCVAVIRSLADDIEKSAENMAEGNMRVLRLHRVAGIRHAVSLMRNPDAFAERAAAIRKGSN